MFPLSTFATIKPVTRQPLIGRENLGPIMAVTSRIQGDSVGAVVSGVQSALDKLGVLVPGKQPARRSVQQPSIASLPRRSARCAAQCAEIDLSRGRDSVPKIVILAR